MSNFSSVAPKAPDRLSGMRNSQIGKNDNFKNEIKHSSVSDKSTDEDWARTEVNVTLPAKVSVFASNKFYPASVLDVSSAQDLNEESGLKGRRKVRNDLAPNLQNHISSGLNFSTTMHKTNSYPGKELHINTDRAHRSSNLSICDDSKILQEHGGLNNSDDGEVNREIGTQRDEFEALDLQFVEKIVDSRSFNMTPPMIDIENEEALVYTCADKCGEERISPCSCSALCVVYDTCCENFSQDCPHILQDARHTFEDLIASDKFCSVDGVFIISSCPTHVEINNMETNELRPNKTVMAEEILKELSENVTDFESLTTSFSPVSLEDTLEERLVTATLRAPVTDASSRITYINKTVYDSHKHEDNNYFVWALKLNYVYTNPKSLEDLGDLEDLDQHEPLFNRAILSRHLCMAAITKSCPATWHAQKGEENSERKCSEFFGLIFSKKVQRFNRNRFCAYCHEGRNTTYSLRNKIIVIQRENNLRMLMTINQAGRYTITVRYPHFYNSFSTSWSKASCKPASETSRVKLQGNLTSITPGQRSVCSVKCYNYGYTLRRDGNCKTPQAAKVAVSDDGLAPLCPKALPGIARFMSCGLQSMIHTMPHAEFRRPTASIQIDSETGKTLYVVILEVDMVFPYREFFSTTDEESLINWRHLEVLAKSLKRYRLANALCGGTDSNTNNFRSDRKQITSHSFEKLMSSTS
ncbi:hypothetical protein RRG08_031068 [Elysia crispata]|uniref:SMB domain-containing protein n=1 Tax=Elysia crispata TaxID=231223 RepID=A0AAE0ZG27_9GAST|nr:hypothetical protein RRG08_031068 [Elysia crispata]